MKKDNRISRKQLLFWVEFSKQIFKKVQKAVQEFSLKYPNLIQIIQITFIYFFALVDLIYSILSTVYALGYYPELLDPVYPLIKAILQEPIFRFWASPEKLFFLSYMVIEFMVVRSVFNFSKLIKYNILLIFALLMIQGLIISYWDFLFNRQIATPVAKWAFDQGALIFTDKMLAVFFFFITFLIFVVIYTFLYFKALRGEFATFRGMSWLTDSISFWLRVKTPTMRFGKRKRKKR
jgi:hypothetical protein